MSITESPQGPCGATGPKSPKDVPVRFESVPIRKRITRNVWKIGPVTEERTVGHITIAMVDMPELFRHDPIALEKYQERIRGIEARLDKVLEKNS